MLQTPYKWKIWIIGRRVLKVKSPKKLNLWFTFTAARIFVKEVNKVGELTNTFSLFISWCRCFWWDGLVKLIVFCYWAYQQTFLMPSSAASRFRFMVFEKASWLIKMSSCVMSSMGVLAWISFIFLLYWLKQTSFSFSIVCIHGAYFRNSANKINFQLLFVGFFDCFSALCNR